jgi:hypothetical protein
MFPAAMSARKTRAIWNIVFRIHGGTQIEALGN